MLPSLRERVPDPSLAEDAECQRIAGKTMEMTVIGVIVAAVVVLFTIPMLWLWVSDRRKRRRRRKLTKDLEGSTAASIKHEKLLKSADPFLYGDTTLAASVSNQPPIVKQKHGKRVERPTKAVTAEQVLGIDKASCLRDIAPGNGGPSPLLTAAPAHMPAGKHELETAGTDAQYINPWEVEYYPNPVLFPHLQDQPNASGSLEHDSYAKLQGIEYPLESDLQAVSLARSVQSAESNSDSPVSSTSSNPTSYASLKTPPIEMKQPTAVMSLPRGRTSDTSNSALLNVSKDIHLQHQCQVCGMECKTPGQLKVHVNRKHRRRYGCGHCNSAFALKADLSDTAPVFIKTYTQRIPSFVLTRLAQCQRRRSRAEITTKDMFDVVRIGNLVDHERETTIKVASCSYCY